MRKHGAQARVGGDDHGELLLSHRVVAHVLLQKHGLLLGQQRSTTTLRRIPPAASAALGGGGAAAAVVPRSSSARTRTTTPHVVAVQVEFESANFETRKTHLRFSKVETWRFKLWVKWN
jgi:hypothetical protein